MTNFCTTEIVKMSHSHCNPVLLVRQNGMYTEQIHSAFFVFCTSINDFSKELSTLELLTETSFLYAASFSLFLFLSSLFPRSSLSVQPPEELEGSERRPES